MLYTASLPESFGSDNKRTVQVKNTESLTSFIRSRNISGDIYNLIGYILYKIESPEELKENLYQIKCWLSNLFGYELDTDFDQKPEYNSWLHAIKKKRKRTIDTSKQNEILPESTLNDYINLPSYHFYQDGISLKTQHEFGIRFDLRTERVVIPVHNAHGQLISLKGRYIGQDDYIKDNMKYLYLHKCDKSIELFNLHRALPYIQQSNEVLIVEGEKTVMFLWQHGIRNVVALGGKSLSPVQAMLLRKLGVTITFIFDKDVDMSTILKQTSQIKNRIVNVVYDEDNLLEDHDSPTDQGFDVFQKLYNNYKQRI